MTAQPGATQGQLVLDNKAPPVSTDARRHAGRGPSRRTAAAAATPTAATASPNGDPAGSIAPSDGSNAAAHRVKWARIRSAATAKQRSQPRTVDAGTPEASRDPPVPRPGGLGQQSDTDIGHRVTATSQALLGQQHMRDATVSAPGPPGHQPPAPLPTTQLALTSPTPRPQPDPAARRHQPSRDKVDLDPDRVHSYDEHSDASGHRQEEPSRHLGQEIEREGSCA